MPSYGLGSLYMYSVRCITSSNINLDRLDTPRTSRAKPEKGSEQSNCLRLVPQTQYAKRCYDLTASDTWKMTEQITPSSDIFYQLEEYPWEADEDFQSGLRAIVGPTAPQEQAEYLTLRAKCFYYSRYIASDKSCMR